MNILCPNCPIAIRTICNKRTTIGYPLDIIEKNYSGCGVDIAHCERCKKQFQISYMVDEITEVTGEKGEVGP